MRKILFVDDEKRICQGLYKIIDWQEFDISAYADAQNGRDAWEKISEDPPDIVITDIKMPYLDGIGLIRKIHQNYRQIKVIVLSGYDEFSLVRDAMRYGAVNYLLKPINRDELTAAIKETLLLFDMEETDSILIMKNNFFNRLSAGEMSHREFRDKSDFLNLDIYSTFYQLLLIEQQTEIPDSHEAINNNLIIKDFCKQAIEDKEYGYVFVNNLGLTVVIILNDLYNPEDILQHATVNNIDINIYVSRTVKSYQKIHLCYNSLLRLIPYKLYYGFNCLITHEAVEKLKTEIADTEKELIKEIVNKIPISVHREVLSEIRVSIVNYPEIKQRLICIEIFVQIYYLLNKFNHEDYHLLSIINNSGNIASLDSLLCNINNLINEIHNFQNREYSNPISKALLYIQKNYSETDLCLKTLADKIDLSPTHLGRLFRKEVNQYFTDYLNAIRINAAKTLLQESKMTVKEISVCVGIDNTNYFYTLCKKILGKNPSEFRNV